MLRCRNSLRNHESLQASSISSSSCVLDDIHGRRVVLLSGPALYLSVHLYHAPPRQPHTAPVQSEPVITSSSYLLHLQHQPSPCPALSSTIFLTVCLTTIDLTTVLQVSPSPHSTTQLTRHLRILHTSTIPIPTPTIPVGQSQPNLYHAVNTRVVSNPLRLIVCSREKHRSSRENRSQSTAFAPPVAPDLSRP